MLTKMFAFALLVAGATSASAVTFAGFVQSDSQPNVFFTGTGATTGDLTSNNDVLFNFSNPEFAGTPQLTAHLVITASLYDIATTSVTKVILGVPKTVYTTTGLGDGAFALTYAGPVPVTYGLLTIHPGDNLLSGTFGSADFTSKGSIGSLSDSIFGGGDVALNSYFLDFDPADDQGFQIGVTSLSSIYLADVLKSFTGTAAGNFAATITDVHYHTDVPEPASWAMMFAGFGLLGTALRRSRRATFAVVTA